MVVLGTMPIVFLKVLFYNQDKIVKEDNQMRVGFIGLGILTVILNVMVLWFVLFAALGMDFLIRYKTTFAGLILFCDGFCGHRHGFPSFDGALCPVRLYRFHSQVAKDAASPHFIF